MSWVTLALINRNLRARSARFVADPLRQPQARVLATPPTLGEEDEDRPPSRSHLRQRERRHGVDGL
jgi:hypothetical protein